MNIDEAKKKALHSACQEEREEAVDTLLALAMERDEMARQADFWYNEVLEIEHAKRSIYRKAIFFVTAAAFHSGAVFMYFIV